MIIRNNRKFFYSDVYQYDIISCHYNILKNNGIDVSNLYLLDKNSRNIEIGKMMKSNQNLIKVLRSTTISIIDNFLLKNKVDKDNIISRQYDGIILSAYINTNETGENEITPVLRNILHNFIISIDRKSYITMTTNGEMVIKGVGNRYYEIDKIYTKIVSINYNSLESIFYMLNKIKNTIYNTDDISLFLIPIDDTDNFYIYLKIYGKIKISKTLSNYLNWEDIDKDFYFNFYFKSFFESIIDSFL